MANVDRLINYNQGAQIIERLGAIRDVLDKEDVNFATCRDTTFLELVKAADRGDIDLVNDCGWTVGDVRDIYLNFPDNDYSIGFTQNGYFRPQHAKLVILDTGNNSYDLVTPTESGRTKTNIMIGLFGVVQTGGPVAAYMGTNYTNASPRPSGYDYAMTFKGDYEYLIENGGTSNNTDYNHFINDIMRNNNLYLAYFPEYLQKSGVIKPFYSTYAHHIGDETAETFEVSTVERKLEVPSLSEYTGIADLDGSKKQFEYFKVPRNRIDSYDGSSLTSPDYYKRFTRSIKQYHAQYVYTYTSGSITKKSLTYRSFYNVLKETDGSVYEPRLPGDTTEPGNTGYFYYNYSIYKRCYVSPPTRATFFFCI